MPCKAGDARVAFVSSGSQGSEMLAAFGSGLLGQAGAESPSAKGSSSASVLSWLLVVSVMCSIFVFLAGGCLLQ